MDYSKTQLANYASMLTGVIMLFAKGLPEDKVSFIVYALLFIGIAIFNFVQRYQKGDLTLGGSRK